MTQQYYFNFSNTSTENNNIYLTHTASQHMDAKNTVIGSVHTVSSASSLVNMTEYFVIDIQLSNRLQVHLNLINISCAKYFMLFPS